MCTGGLFMVGSVYDFFTLKDQVRKANMERALLDGGAYNAGYAQGRQIGEASKGFVDGLLAKDPVMSGGMPMGGTLEQTILKTAKRSRGVLTPSEVALNAGISIDQAKKELDDMVSKGHAELRVKKTGALAYVIPDMLESGTDFEEF